MGKRLQPTTIEEAAELARKLFQMTSRRAIREAREILESYRNGAGAAQLVVKIAAARQTLGPESCRFKSSKQVRIPGV